MLLFGGVADDEALETSTFFNDVSVPPFPALHSRGLGCCLAVP
jgi:hypothetical protein